MATPAELPAPGGDRLGRAILLGFALLYAASFLAYGCRDTAPRPWDESYFLYLPTAVLGALRHEGLAAALQTFWETPYSKPPLSMFGTLPSMAVFGHGSLGYRIDNLVVVLGAVWLGYRLLRPMLPAPLPAVFACGLAAAPYSLLFARTEFAELYLWASTILYLLVLLRCDAFAHRRWSLGLGVALGCGMLCKLSFPLVLGPPTLWVLVAALRRDGGRGLGRRAGNALLALAIGAAMFAPFYAKNWKLIKQHFRDQFEWLGKEYSIGDPWRLETLQRYFHTWWEWYGGLWQWLAVLAVGLAVLALLLGRGRRLLTGWPAGPLLVGGAVNLVYCYFHPVFDPRFSYGTMLLLQIATGCLLGRSLEALGLARRPVAIALLLPFLCFLASNSHWPGDGRRVLDVDWPVVGPAKNVLFPPVPGIDLAEQILPLQPVAPGEELWIALAGDHMRVSNDTIRLRMLQQHLAGDVMQIGYMGPKPTMLERFLSVRRARLWLVVLDRGTTPETMSRESSWASRYAPEALAMLRVNPQAFTELPWQQTLPDGVQVFAFRRTVDLDAAGLKVPPAPPGGWSR